MANEKVTDLTALATPALEDLIYIVDDPEGNVMQLLNDKRAAFDEMQQEMNQAMAEHGLFREESVETVYSETEFDKSEGDNWTFYLGDCVQVMAKLPPGGTPVSKSATLTVVDALLRSNDLAFVATATATVANTTDETTIIGSGVGSLTLAASFFSVGKSLRIKLMGVISNTGTPTINIRFKLGATTICLSGAVTTPASLSNDLFSAEILLTCRTIGATGTVFAQGQLQIGDTVSQMPATAAATVDTTGTLAVNVTAEWGSADVANTISITNAIVEKLN